MALVPIVTAATRALRNGWFPLSDNALMAIRAHDVLSAHPPLLGTWTSGSLAAGVDINHPGPLLFDWLAIPVRLLGPGAGIVVGVSLLQAASIVGIAVFAARRGGPLLSMAATLATTGLCLAMGSGVLLEPWNPHVTLLPFLWYLVLVWSVAAGDRAALPWAVGVASLVVQTHLSYALLVPLLGAWAVASLVVRRLLTSRQDRSRGAIRGLARPALLATAVLLVCWAQPLVEQATKGESGNLSRLATHGSSGATAGLSTSMRLVADVALLPPFWSRGAFRDSWLPQPHAIVAPKAALLPSTARAAVALGLVGLALLVGARSAWRRGDRSAVAASTTALVALVIAVPAAAQSPLGSFGLSPHQFRWLWPFGAFVALTLASGAISWFRDRAPRSWGTRAGVGIAVATGLVALANVPAYNDPVTPNSTQSAIPVVHALASQFGSLKGGGPYLIDHLYVGFADPYSVALIAEMQRRGVPFVTAVPSLARQYGENRRIHLPNGEVESLVLAVGPSAEATPSGLRLVARYVPSEQGNPSERNSPAVAVFVGTPRVVAAALSTQRSHRPNGTP